MAKNFRKLYFKDLEESTNFAPPKVSFEFFPPKTEEMEKNMWDTIEDLESLHPDFVSVTYGAGGSTRTKTHEIVTKILSETSLKPASHLTCVEATKEEINKIAKTYWDENIRHIVALRGDPPNGVGDYSPHPGGYAYANELVQGLKKVGDFQISVACYPESHPQATSPEADLEYLKKKIEAGADRAISQCFFDAEIFLRFVDKARNIGITAPIVPGIINISNYDQIIRFSNMCQSTIPTYMHEILEPIKDDPDLTKEASVQISAKICRDLLKEGIDQFHFYTLNRSDMTKDVCKLINVTAK